MDLSYGDKYLANVISYYKEMKNKNRVIFYEFDSLKRDEQNTIFDPSFELFNV